MNCWFLNNWPVIHILFIIKKSTLIIIAHQIIWVWQLILIKGLRQLWFDMALRLSWLFLTPSITLKQWLHKLFIPILLTSINISNVNWNTFSTLWAHLLRCGWFLYIYLLIRFKNRIRTRNLYQILVYIIWLAKFFLVDIWFI